jgi:hypothetical protein
MGLKKDEKKQYKLIFPKVWTGLLLYLVISVICGELLMKYVEDALIAGYFGLATIFMLIFVSVCMFTERGDWNIFIRIIFVPAMWIVNSILGVLLTFPAFILFSSLPIENNYFIDLIGLLASGLLIIAFSMSRSKLFIEAKTSNDNKEA